jgi:hypothetical protein
VLRLLAGLNGLLELGADVLQLLLGPLEFEPELLIVLCEVPN